MSIKITIISNITVSISHNVICFRYFMPMRHGVNKKAPPVVSPTSPPYQVFNRFICCFTRNTLSNFFCSDLIVVRIMHFQRKTVFFSTCWRSVLILLFCVYVFLRALFYSFAIMKIRTALYLHICIASYLASHQIIWHNKKLKALVWKLQAIVVSLVSEET